jgi:hypothetical protein
VARAWSAVGGGRRRSGAGGARTAGGRGDARAAGVGGATVGIVICAALAPSTMP